MDEFEIEYLQQLYTVKPQDDGDFIIYQGATYIGRIEATIADDATVKWLTADLMSLDLAQKVGEQIEFREL